MDFSTSYILAMSTNHQKLIKAAWVSLLICLFSINTYSQGKNRMTVYSGISSNALFRKENLVGAGSDEGKGATVFGIRYLRNLNNSFSIESGLEYSSDKVESSSAFYPGIPRTYTKSTIGMVSIPVYGYYNFLKYLFINAGPTVDLETNRSENRAIDPQSGIGYGIGLGGNLRFKKISIVANPFFQKHALIPFSRNVYPQKLAETGVKLGVGYHF